MKRFKYRIPIEESPADWIPLTDAYPIVQLMFAVNQLEAARKPYAIERKNDETVVIWTAKR